MPRQPCLPKRCTPHTRSTARPMPTRSSPRPRWSGIWAARRPHDARADPPIAHDPGTALSGHRAAPVRQESFVTTLDGGGHDPQVQAALDEWRRIFLHRDWDALSTILADGVTYHTPADAFPLRGKQTVVASLQQSFDLFETFGYARDFVGEGGHVLEFCGTVGGTAF